MKNYNLIVALYDDKELDTVCNNNAPDACERIVCLRSPAVRIFLKRVQHGPNYQIILSEKSEYTAEDKVFYCRHLADRALGLFAETKIVIVVVPAELERDFLGQLEIAKDESLGDVLIPRFRMHLEKFDRSKNLKHTVFAVRDKPDENKPTEWKSYFFPYFYSGNRSSGISNEPLPAGALGQGKSEVQTVYEELLKTGDYSALQNYSLEFLSALELKAASCSEFEIAYEILKIQKSKEK